VVREHQVVTAGLHVEGGAQVVGGDGRALHVPAGPAAAEPRVPGRLAGPFCPPDDDVERVLLARAVRIAAAFRGQLQHLRQRQVRQRARARQRTEARIGAPREVDVTVQLVQRAPVGQPLSEPLDDRDRLDRPDQLGRRDQPEGLHVAAEQLNLPRGQVAPVLAVPLGPLQQRVVHVGHVLDVGHRPARVQPGPDEQVPGGERRRVSDMGRVVGGDPAGVDRGGTRSRVAGRRPYLTGRRVPEPRLGSASGQRGKARAPPGIHEHRLSCVARGRPGRGRRYGAAGGQAPAASWRSGARVGQAASRASGR